MGRREGWGGEREALPLRPGWEGGSFPRPPLPLVPGGLLGAPLPPSPSVPAFSGSRRGLQSPPPAWAPGCGSQLQWAPLSNDGWGWGVNGQMWAESTPPEGPGAGKQPPLELARHSAPVPRRPCSAHPRRCRALPLAEETQALPTGSLGLRGRQDTGSTLKWPVIIFSPPLS